MALTDVDRASLVQEAMTEVFETMVFTTIEPEPPTHEQESPAAEVMGAVGFLGSVNGTVAFYASTEAACEVAGLLLGISPDEAAEGMPDAVGEITNMIAGSVRGRLTRQGEQVMITTPTVTRGLDFRAQHFNVSSRVLCPFAMGAHKIYAELILQAS